MGHGELWCGMLMAAKCQQLGADAQFMDTRDVLVVTPTSDGNSVDVQYEVCCVLGGVLKRERVELGGNMLRRFGGIGVETVAGKQGSVRSGAAGDVGGLVAVLQGMWAG